MLEPAVVLDGLEKRYGATTALAGLALTAQPAAVTALLGPNGAGKTTTVEICAGLRRPDAGQVRVLGLDPTRDTNALRPQVGVMPTKEGSQHFASICISVPRFLVPVQTGERGNTRSETWVTPDAAC